MKWLSLLLIFAAACSEAAVYPGDKVKLKRESIMCRAVTYLAEVEGQLRRGNVSGANRFVNMGRCKKNSSTTRAQVLGFGHDEGRPDYIKVKAKGGEYWIRYSDIRS